MTTQERRTAILNAIQKSAQPISAKVLAQQYKVSRQTIVGDIALLRAQGAQIIATVSGYYDQTQTQQTMPYQAQVACQHNQGQTELELITIVENGGRVIDVTVDHPLYGELTGQLGIGTLTDVKGFMQKMATMPHQKLLSTLTDGIHLHTIECASEQRFKQIVAALKQINIYYNA
ncbi:transcription repressor NadR [Latilactobacillus curvatus]|uniref:transcription repressor NadR n=1 Tax=Latilactobacillus curvatus TaxID=28038 RepID=UPI000FECCEBB|nr:transcription repressor NadR [Latilactobacillus curvatus]MDT3394077.1 transcription repressor NadR [Bacillota bacterium]QAR35007.1 transcription repressor NadR [Latilactobacillus curvatus]